MEVLPIVTMYTGLEILPVELSLVVLELSGHIRRGTQSMSFVIYF